MVVVSNTSPLLNLAAIGELDVLFRLFGKITAPNGVRDEIESLRKRTTRFSAAHLGEVTDFVPIQDRARVAMLSLHLDLGEAEAITLALDMKADLLLLDERLATRIAARLGLKTLGLLGVLLLAKQRGILHEISPLLNRLEIEAGFWIGPELRLRVISAAHE